MSKVESGRGGGPINLNPPLKASCNYFLLKVSRVNKILWKTVYCEYYYFVKKFP